ncbi:uncharacterized protein LOC142578231 [Dermacentor variabilis]|uniref:uncharacterized protein LOC142578231 n=1 Tax=Dermacentor variabilis TaxID=34621 RepID=UPI003F5C95B9
MTRKAVLVSAAIIFVYLIVHCVFLHYTFRNVLLCLDKYRLNKNTNAQAKEAYSSSITFYGLRTVLNVINVLVDVSALTALLMTVQNGFITSRSGWILIRCCSDVRDALAMYLGCSIVLTIASALCRTVEIYIMTFTPYDTTECCGLKWFLHRRGRFDNPEYSANTVSRYVGFAIISFLMTGFKVRCADMSGTSRFLLRRQYRKPCYFFRRSSGRVFCSEASGARHAVVMLRLFELYDDISETVRLNTLAAKLRDLLAYDKPSYYGNEGNLQKIHFGNLGEQCEATLPSECPEDQIWLVQLAAAVAAETQGLATA